MNPYYPYPNEHRRAPPPLAPNVLVVPAPPMPYPPLAPAISPDGLLYGINTPPLNPACFPPQASPYPVFPPQPYPIGALHHGPPMQRIHFPVGNPYPYPPIQSVVHRHPGPVRAAFHSDRDGFHSSSKQGFRVRGGGVASTKSSHFGNRNPQHHPRRQHPHPKNAFLSNSEESMASSNSSHLQNEVAASVSSRETLSNPSLIGDTDSDIIEETLSMTGSLAETATTHTDRSVATTNSLFDCLRTQSSYSSAAASEPSNLARRLEQRQKQIDFGKNTIGYKRYLDQVPKEKRKRGEPQTPDKHMNCSKRCWDGMIRSWRRKLHEYDPPSHASPGEPSDLADVSCSIASPASDGVGPLLVSGGLGDADCSPDSKTQTPNSVKSVLDGSSCDYSPRAIRKTRPRSRSDEMHLRSSQLADDSLAGVAALNLEELCNDSDLWLPPSPTPKPRGHCCCADHPSGDLSPTPRPTPVNAARCRSPFMGSDLASCPPLALPSPDSHRASPSATFMTRADNDADTIALAHAETLHLAASADAADASGDAVDFRSYVDQYVQSFSPSKLLKKRSSSMDIEDGPEMAQSPRASLPEPPSETRAHDASEIPNELVDRTRNVFLTNGIVQDLESFDSVVQQFVRDADDSASDYIRDGRQGPSPKSHTSATVATSDTCKVVAGPSSTGPSLHSFSTTAPGYTRHNSMPLPDDVSPSATVASSAYFKSQKTAVREARSLTVDHSASDEAVEGVDVFWR